VFSTIKKEEVLITKTKVVKKDSIQLGIFPEGGYLVSGVQNKLAYKALNTKGFPVKVSGALYENDAVLKTFKSVHAGMGSLTFISDSNKKYYIKLDDVTNTNS